MFLTAGTVPEVILSELFFAGEFVETIVQVDVGFFPRLFGGRIGVYPGLGGGPVGWVVGVGEDVLVSCFGPFAEEGVAEFKGGRLGDGGDFTFLVLLVL